MLSFSSQGRMQMWGQYFMTDALLYCFPHDGDVVHDDDDGEYDDGDHYDKCYHFVWG